MFSYACACAMNGISANKWKVVTKFIYYLLVPLREELLNQWNLCNTNLLRFHGFSGFILVRANSGLLFKSGFPVLV